MLVNKQLGYKNNSNLANSVEIDEGYRQKKKIFSGGRGPKGPDPLLRPPLSLSSFHSSPPFPLSPLTSP